MKIKLKTSLAGLTFGHRCGDIVDLPEATAQRLIARAEAEPVVEQATVVVRETAEGKGSRRRRAPIYDVGTASTAAGRA
jgi:hypothetical protein